MSIDLEENVQNTVNEIDCAEHEKKTPWLWSAKEVKLETSKVIVRPALHCVSETWIL
jgi:hypothetical protein